MKSILSRLFTLVLIGVIGLTSLTGCSSTPKNSLSGDYRQDTLAIVNGLRNAIELPDDSPAKASAQEQTKQIIYEYASRYRRDNSVANLSSYTTVRTALNALAGHYSSYPNRPIPEKLKARLRKELKQVEGALKRNN